MNFKFVAEKFNMMFIQMKDCRILWIWIEYIIVSLHNAFSIVVFKGWPQTYAFNVFTVLETNELIRIQFQ